MVRLASGGSRPSRAAGLASLAVVFALCVTPSLGLADAKQQSGFNFRSFCTAVDSKALSNNPAHETVLYQYQDMLLEAARVPQTDTDAVAHLKIGAFLNANAPLLTCNMVNFNPRNGSIYKLAVARQADSFIDDALDNWHVDLNQIDATDGKTVLDYISDRRSMAGPTYARTLDRYYKRFRAAGAKHAAELH